MKLTKQALITTLFSIATLSAQAQTAPQLFYTAEIAEQSSIEESCRVTKLNGSYHFRAGLTPEAGNRIRLTFQDRGEVIHFDAKVIKVQKQKDAQGKPTQLAVTVQSESDRIARRFPNDIAATATRTGAWLVWNFPLGNRSETVKDCSDRNLEPALRNLTLAHVNNNSLLSRTLDFDLRAPSAGRTLNFKVQYGAQRGSIETTLKFPATLKLIK